MTPKRQTEELAKLMPMHLIDMRHNPPEWMSPYGWRSEFELRRLDEA